MHTIPGRGRRILHCGVRATQVARGVRSLIDMAAGAFIVGDEGERRPQRVMGLKPKLIVVLAFCDFHEPFSKPDGFLGGR